MKRNFPAQSLMTTDTRSLVSLTKSLANYALPSPTICVLLEWTDDETFKKTKASNIDEIRDIRSVRTNLSRPTFLSVVAIPMLPD